MARREKVWMKIASHFGDSVFQKVPIAIFQKKIKLPDIELCRTKNIMDRLIGRMWSE
jgi:hypothetical protein